MRVAGGAIMLVLPREIIGILAHVQGTDEKRVLRFESRDQEGVRRRGRPVGIDLRASESRQPGNVEQVLDAVDDPRERADTLAARAAGIDLIRPGTRTV